MVLFDPVLKHTCVRILISYKSNFKHWQYGDMGNVAKTKPLQLLYKASLLLDTGTTVELDSNVSDTINVLPLGPCPYLAGWVPRAQ